MPYMYAYMHIHNKLLDTFFNSFSDHQYSMCTLLLLLVVLLFIRHAIMHTASKHTNVYNISILASHV